MSVCDATPSPSASERALATFEVHKWSPEREQLAVLQQPVHVAAALFFERLRAPCTVFSMARHLLHTHGQSTARHEPIVLQRIVYATMQTLCFEPLAMCLVYRENARAAATAHLANMWLDTQCDDWFVYPFGLRSIVLPLSALRSKHDVLLAPCLMRMVARSVSACDAATRGLTPDATATSTTPAFRAMQASSSGSSITFSDFRFNQTYDTVFPRTQLMCAYMCMATAHCTLVDRRTLGAWVVISDAPEQTRGRNAAASDDDDDDDERRSVLTSERHELRSLMIAVLSRIVGTAERLIRSDHSVGAMRTALVWRAQHTGECAYTLLSACQATAGAAFSPALFLMVWLGVFVSHVHARRRVDA